ncbi:MAG: nucleoside phosphorylase [Desulfobacca sp.]|nr:nucleoside phosphorylase [Desulfobacca sp.]
MSDNQDPDGEAVVITPRRGRREASIPLRVVMTFVRQDYQDLCGLAGTPGKTREFADCPYREGVWCGRPLTIVGPAPGAPYAVLVMEKLIALGARAILGLGWCGSLQADLKVGDLVVPDAAHSEEGTSPHYPVSEPNPGPDPILSGLLSQQLHRRGYGFHTGKVWTTDAFYRETVHKVKSYGEQGILAVDMEMSALFTVGQFRRVAVAGLLIVSDELAGLTWRHGFRQARLHQARQQAAQVALDTLAAWEGGHD